MFEFELVPLPLRRFHFRARAQHLQCKRFSSSLNAYKMHIFYIYYVHISIEDHRKNCLKKATTINWLHGPPNFIAYRSICNLYLNKHFCCIPFRFLWKYICSSLDTVFPLFFKFFGSIGIEIERKCVDFCTKYLGALSSLTFSDTQLNKNPKLWKL